MGSRGEERSRGGLAPWLGFAEQQRLEREREKGRGAERSSEQTLQGAVTGPSGGSNGLSSGGRHQCIMRRLSKMNIKYERVVN
uniref:Uncharacterized protein n=1 Tax=Oryza glumipatula TaxID=40148 RepID=A0A0D9Z759_9ORYZ